MANSFPGSGLAYADAFSVGTANAVASTLYVASSCAQAVRIEHNYNQSNLHHNTLWLRATNSGPNLGASIGFTVVNNGGDHHRANILSTANSGQIGGNLALYTRNNNGNDTLGYYQDHSGNVGINTTSPETRFQVTDTSNFGNTTFNARSDGGYLIFQEAGTTRAYLQWGLTIGGSAGGCSLLVTNAEPGGNLALQTANDAGVANVCALVVTNTGNIGIATSTPNSCARVQINVTGAGCYGLMINKTDANESTIRFKSTHGCGSDYRIGASIYVDSAFEVAQQENGCSRFVIRCTGNVGIGTYTPSSKLDVSGADGRIQSRVDSSDGSTINVRPNAGKCGWISYTEDAVADRWGIGVKNGDAKLYFASGNVGSGGGTTRMVLDGNGSVGINTSTPGSYKLNVNGAFYAAGSSKEYKTSICEYNTDSCMFMKLKPVTYDYKEEWKHLGKELKSGTQIGLIAEDVAEVYPELAILKDEEDNKVVRNVDYEKLSIVLLSEVQKLRKELDELKTK